MRRSRRAFPPSLLHRLTAAYTQVQPSTFGNVVDGERPRKGPCQGMIAAIRNFFKPEPWEAELEALEKMQPDGNDHRAIVDKLLELGDKSFMIPQSQWGRKERTYWYLYRRFSTRWAYRLAMLHRLQRDGKITINEDLKV